MIWSQEHMKSLEVTFQDFNDTTFKELRRMLPVTRTKFPWDTAASKLATDLRTFSLASAVQGAK